MERKIVNCIFSHGKMIIQIRSARSEAEFELDRDMDGQEKGQYAKFHRKITKQIRRVEY